LLGPLSITALLVVWTIIVSPHSGYGDKWAIWPVILTAPVAVIWHMGLSVRHPGSRSAIVGIAHILVFAPIWLICAVSITKDGL
jgi:hypothetical protein